MALVTKDIGEIVCPLHRTWLVGETDEVKELPPDPQVIAPAEQGPVVQSLPEPLIVELPPEVVIVPVV